jgi:hypothetical protein
MGEPTVELWYAVVTIIAGVVGVVVLILWATNR